MAAETIGAGYRRSSRVQQRRWRAQLRSGGGGQPAVGKVAYDDAAIVVDAHDGYQPVGGDSYDVRNRLEVTQFGTFALGSADGDRLQGSNARLCQMKGA